MISQKTRNVWVFGFTQDLTFFLLPILMGGILTILSSKGFRFDSVWIAPLLLFLNRTGDGHIFGTLVPVNDKFYWKKFGKRLLCIPLLALAWNCGAFWLSQTTFTAFIGYFAIYHILMQQWGWLHRLEHKGSYSTQRTKIIDRIAFWNSHLGPIFFWLSGASRIPMSFFFDNNLVFKLPILFWYFYQPIYWGILTVFLLNVIYDSAINRTIQAGKFLFFLFTWVWLFGGLVILQSPAFFWFALVTIHGWGYHFHIHEYWRTSKEYRPWPWMTSQGFQKYLLYFIFDLALSYGLWFSIRASRQDHAWAWLTPLVWTPLLCHYFFDSVLWRNRTRALGQM